MESRFLLVATGRVVGSAHISNLIYSKRKTAHARLSARAAGGTVGIDQEVVTLRGLFGNSGSQRDLTPGGSQP